MYIEQVVDLTMWVGLHWMNEKVSWDPGEYEDTKRVDFTEKSDMWMPDTGYYIQSVQNNGANSFLDLACSAYLRKLQLIVFNFYKIWNEICQFSYSLGHLCYTFLKKALD